MQDAATIVGVVADAMWTSAESQTSGAIYRPLRPQTGRSNPPSLLVRSSNPATTARRVGEAVRPLDPRARASTRIVRTSVDDALDAKRRLAWLIAPAAILALLLAALGVYGVNTFIVGQRLDEVSVRMALGASTSDVRRLLLGDGLRPAVAGLTIGLVAALVLARLLARALMLSGISPHDPLSIGIAVTTLLASVLLAVLLPARRAARMDPAALLRRE
jgi:predicted lysophospholipase L1 biosynthesis ABC-type transport system permease subunit